jgi:small subunit ribosomal protein S13
MVAVVRIAGVNLPSKKKIYVSLSYIFGIGRKTGKEICRAVNVDYELRVEELSDDDVEKIRNYIVKNFLVEGDLREQIAYNIKLKISIGCYEGSRHRLRLPLRQRTKTNARTRKGRGAPIANKKIVAK